MNGRKGITRYSARNPKGESSLYDEESLLELLQKLDEADAYGVDGVKKKETSGGLFDSVVNAISDAIADGQNIPVRLFVGQLDLTTGQLRYCNAGNNTPLLTDEEISLLPIDDTAPAGSLPGSAYTAQETTIAPGKLLFLYTDGIAKAKDADGKVLGDKQIRGMALQAVKLNAKPQPFYDNILKAIDKYTAGAPQAEDLTLMVIARK